MKGLFVVLALALQAAPAPVQTPVASAVATRVWNEFQAVRWGMPYADWRRTHSEASCEPFVAPADDSIDYAIGGVEWWSYRCRRVDPTIASTWLFYAFDPNTPVPRLEQFRMSVDGDGVQGGDLAGVHRLLAARLTTQLGAGERPTTRGLGEFGSAYWRETVRWNDRELQIYLYLDASPWRAGKQRLTLQVRHRALLDTLANIRKLGSDTGSQWEDSGTPLDSALTKELGSEFAAVGALLTLPPEAERTQPALREALARLMVATRSSTSDRRALLLMAADRLAARVGETELEVPGWEAERKRLASFGLNFEWSELGGTWLYTHDLLWRLWKEHGDTPWGGQAFLRLLRGGWDTSVGCRSGSDRFRNVITNGEQFLRDRPATPSRAQVLLALAESYETWWSLSRASEREAYATPGDYQKGADVARQRAIGYYEDLLRLNRAGNEAGYARLALPRLKLGIDTGQRQFFCVYD